MVRLKRKLTLEASTAAVGDADSDSFKKGRQNKRANKRAEKAASKERALLQSAETGVLETTNAFESTNAVEATIDDELLRELKQRNILPAATLTSFAMTQAPTSVGEPAAH